jgi:hypothetical protein
MFTFDKCISKGQIKNLKTLAVNLNAEKGATKHLIYEPILNFLKTLRGSATCLELTAENENIRVFVSQVFKYL